MNAGYFFIGFAAGGAVFTVVWLTFHNYFWKGLRKIAEGIRTDYGTLLREHWKVCTELQSVQAKLAKSVTGPEVEECVVSGAGRTINISEIGDPTMTKVELLPAHFWICPDCYEENFERCITVEPESDTYQELAEELPVASEMNGFFLSSPDRVECCACGAEFGVTNLGSEEECP